MGYAPETHNVSVYRFKKTGSKTDYDVTPTYTGVNCAILPASTDILAVYPAESAFQLYEIHVFDMSLSFKNGDKFIDPSNNEWIIRGVPQVFNIPQISYQRLVGEKVV